MIVTSASQCRNALAAAMPAKPPPMITTCGLLTLSGGCEMPNDSLIFCSRYLSSPEVPEASARFGILSAHLKRFLGSDTKLEEPEQHFVAFCRKRVDGARPDFGMNAVDELPLHFGRQHRASKRFPPSCHGTGELLEKVLDAACTAAQVIEEHVAHEPPTQARSPAQRSVDIGGADDAFANKIADFPSAGRLQTIGDMPGHLFAYSNRPPSNALVEFRDALNGLFGGLGATHDFDQWDEVRGIERMADYTTLGLGAAACLDFAHRGP